MNHEATIKRLDEISKEYNPCGFHQVDGQTRCVGEANRFTPCCQGCRHLTANGCSVNAVMCKFYFCKWSWERLPEVIRDEIKQLFADYPDQLRFRHDGHLIARDRPFYGFGHIPYRIYG